MYKLRFCYKLIQILARKAITLYIVLQSVVLTPLCICIETVMVYEILHFP